MVRFRLAALVLLATSVIPALAADTDDQLRQKIVGYWGDSDQCQGSVLVFRSDGTVDEIEVDRTRTPSVSTIRTGTYQIAAGKLSGKMGGTVMPLVDLRFDGDTMVLVDGTDESPVTRCPAGPK